MFKISWDRENNGVILSMRSTDEMLNVPPRPVFFEELDLLGLDKYWGYPKSKEPLLWACDRRYFYCGEQILEVKGGNIFDDPQLIFTHPNVKIRLKPIDVELLGKNNETTMFLLEHEALEFINTIYRRYRPNANQQIINDSIDFQKLADNQGEKQKEKYTVIKEDCDSFDIMPLSEAEKQGKQIVLNTKIEMFIASFSGGKDSQVVLDLVSRVIPPDDFSVIYSDTGYEIPPSLKLYAQTKALYQKRHPDLQFHLSKNHQDVLYYWEQMGSPSRIHRWCCSVMKSAPLSRKIKEISKKNKQPHSILFDGVRAEESNNRANRARIGKNVKHNNIINVSPILDWNSTEVYLYLLFQNLPMNQGYRNGLSRVGCVICPYSSSWSEDLCGKLYPNVAEPFIEKLRESLNKAKINGVDNYIKLGNWKMRAGGRGVYSASNLNIIAATPDFKAILHNSQEDFFTWLRVLGKYTISKESGKAIGDLKYKKQIYRFEVTKNDNNIIVEFKDVGTDIIFLSHLKKVLYKSTHCVHCEVCEVECPVGALSVVPVVSVDDNLCVHCHKCLDFDGKGCVTASSVSVSTNNNNMKTSKTGINRYNDGMGLREAWLQKYFSKCDHFFDDDSHGLNVRYQIPPLVNWLKEAKILHADNKLISDCGKFLAESYPFKPTIVWEIIYVNLCEHSEICNWFQANIDFNRTYLKSEIEVLLQESYPDLKDRTIKNPLNSLLNTFKESPLGKKEIGAGIIHLVDNKPAMIRIPHDSISLVATAYSLYRYAERNKRKNLTISEFYAQNQKEGIYREFGVSRERFEAILRTLKEDNNRPLDADLNMGLDNINLREDLSSMDVLKMLM